VHRKHPGKYNPLAEMKQKPPTFGDISQIPQPQGQEFRSSSLKHSDSLDPQKMYGDMRNVQNIFQQIKQLDQTEFNFLLIMMTNLIGKS